MSGAEHQKTPRSSASAPPPVDQTTQRLKQLRYAMDFIENDQLVLVVSQKKLRIAELVAVGLRFKVEVQRWPGFGQLMRQGGLAHLPRSDERHCCLAGQGGFDFMDGVVRDHPCLLQRCPSLCNNNKTAS